MSLTLTKPSIVDLLLLARAMSAEEVDQFETAAGIDHSAEAVARIVAGYGGIEYLALDEDNNPVSAFGLFEVSPGVYQTWMVSRADAFERHGRALTRMVRSTLRKLLEVDGIRRIQTMAAAHRGVACRWYVKGLGMHAEGVRRAFYPDGTDAAEFAAVKGD